jgi:hypothetical protein
MERAGHRGRRHRDDRALLGLARVAIADPQYAPGDGPEGPFFCRACTSVLDIPKDLEPTPLCNVCAQDASYELGAEILRIYDVLGSLPPVVSAPIFEALKNGSARAGAFIRDVLSTTAQHVLGEKHADALAAASRAARSGRHKK